MSDQPDLTKLSYAELRALLQQTEAALEDKRAEELKVLSDGFAKKLVAGGFTVQEGIEALRPYLPAKAERAARQPTFRNPTRTPKFANPDAPRETWGGMGKQPKWFKDQLARGHAREEMLISPEA
jgi:DNA-binding protein H-NS